MKVTALPKDWDLLPLGDVAHVYAGGTPSRAVASYWGGEIPWVTTAEIDAVYITSSRERITTEALSFSAAKIAQPGTLLLAMYGQGKTRGKVAMLRIPSAMNQACAAIEVGTRVDAGYLLYYLSAQYDAIRGLSNSGSQDNLNGDIVKGIPVAVPPIPEQRAIAAALDDVTGLTKELEGLIAKKRDIKQGMLQELLTGKTRLPGFAGDWRDVRLGDVLTVRHGRSQKAVEDPAGVYPILASGGQIGWSRTPIYMKPSVLIGRKGTIDRPQFQDRPFWTVDTLFYTEVSTSADPRFVYYVFLTIDWRSMNEASGVPSLSSSRVESVEVRVPEVEEQKAIRAVLDDAGAEIDALKRRLGSVRTIKTGMMQELLTGQTRLPAEAAS